MVSTDLAEVIILFVGIQLERKRGRKRRKKRRTINRRKRMIIKRKSRRGRIKEE